MNWSQAKQRTIEQWRALIPRIGSDDPLDLLAEVNGVTALCEQARIAAAEHGDWHKCRYCIAFEQQGGCGAVEAVLSEKLMSHEWDEARDLARRVLSDLEALDIPDDDDLATPS
jgi:hypothetical protein